MELGRFSGTSELQLPERRELMDYRLLRLLFLLRVLVRIKTGYPEQMVAHFSHPRTAF